MAANSPPRIPKGSKEGGRPSPPKWAKEMRQLVDQHHDNIRDLFIRVGVLRGAVFGSDESDSESLIAKAERQGNDIADLSSRIGTSTPLIIWNIAVLIAIAYLYCKAYVPGTP